MLDMDIDLRGRPLIIWRGDVLKIFAGSIFFLCEPPVSWATQGFLGKGLLEFIFSWKMTFEIFFSVSYSPTPRSLTLKLPYGVQWTPDNIPTAVKVKRKINIAGVII